LQTDLRTTIVEAFNLQPFTSSGAMGDQAPGARREGGHKAFGLLEALLYVMRPVDPRWLEVRKHNAQAHEAYLVDFYRFDRPFLETLFYFLPLGGILHAGTIPLGVIFASAHTIAEWSVRMRDPQWRSHLTPWLFIKLLGKDLIEFGIRFLLSSAFLVPFQLIPYIPSIVINMFLLFLATVLSFKIHSGYNRDVHWLRENRPSSFWAKWLPMAAIGGDNPPETEESEPNRRSAARKVIDIQTWKQRIGFLLVALFSALVVPSLHAAPPAAAIPPSVSGALSTGEAATHTLLDLWHHVFWPMLYSYGSDYWIELTALAVAAAALFLFRHRIGPAFRRYRHRPKFVALGSSTYPIQAGRGGRPLNVLVVAPDDPKQLEMLRELFKDIEFFIESKGNVYVPIETVVVHNSVIAEGHLRLYNSTEENVRAYDVVVTTNKDGGLLALKIHKKLKLEIPVFVLTRQSDPSVDRNTKIFDREILDPASEYHLRYEFFDAFAKATLLTTEKPSASVHTESPEATSLEPETAPALSADASVQPEKSRVRRYLSFGTALLAAVSFLFLFLAGDNAPKGTRNTSDTNEFHYKIPFKLLEPDSHPFDDLKGPLSPASHPNGPLSALPGAAQNPSITTPAPRVFAESYLPRRSTDLLSTHHEPFSLLIGMGALLLIVPMVVVGWMVYQGASMVRDYFKRRHEQFEAAEKNLVIDPAEAELKEKGTSAFMESLEGINKVPGIKQVRKSIFSTQV
jgi:hypothetical protein